MDFEKEAVTLLSEYLGIAPAFRLRPIGAPNSPARTKQDHHISVEDRTRALLSRLRTGEKADE